MSSLGRIDSIKTIHSKEIRKSLNLVIIAVAFGMAFTTVQTGPSLTGFIRELGVEDFLYSVIMALPVLGGVTQVFASYILENSGERKRILIVSGLIQIPVHHNNDNIIIPFVLLHDCYHNYICHCQLLHTRH
jgi:hypothetical protein